MQGGRRWDQVWRVAVGQKGPVAEAKAALIHGGLLRNLLVLLQHSSLLALFILVGHFPVPCLDAILLHGEGPVNLLRRKKLDFHLHLFTS